MAKKTKDATGAAEFGKLGRAFCEVGFVARDFARYAGAENYVFNADFGGPSDGFFRIVESRTVICVRSCEAVFARNEPGETADRQRK